MSVVYIILKILSIIGIVLLSILAFLLLLILVILFVPVRYRAEGFYNKEDYSFKAKASWLCHIISFTYDIKVSEPLIKIFGIRLKQKTFDKPTDESQSIPQNIIPDEDIPLPDEKSPLPEEDTPLPEQDTPSSNENKAIDSTRITEAENNSVNNEKTSSRKHKNKNHVLKKKKHKHKKKKFKFSFVDRFKKFYGKIEYYKSIIQSKRFKKAFALCKKTLIKVLKSILPKKWFIKGTLAFEDPATVGKAMGIYGMLYSVLYKHCDIEFLFDDDIIDINLYAKGHIRLIVLLVAFIRIYFNRNIKTLIKLFNSEVV